jgi:putative tricarboxylic transport membrane protein
MLENLQIGLATAVSAQNLLYCLLGVSLGTFFGVLPGIGALASVSMLMPLALYLPPATALIMLAGVYYGAEYGGSISSILLNLPGTPSNAVTCLDGYPLASQGKAGLALFVTTISSYIGGTIGILALFLFSPVITSVALEFGPAEFFTVILFGLIAAATVTDGSPLKGLCMVLLGLMLGTVGTDLETGTDRFTLGLAPLEDGVSFIALATGLFGVSEIILSIRDSGNKTQVQQVKFWSMIPSWSEFKSTWWPTLRGAGIGVFFGALPGTGPTIASFVGYSAEKRLSKTPEQFGKGALAGIANPESANNAAAQAAFIPTLTLGIPGSATMAIMMGALLIHGIAPGPQLINERPDLFWGLAMSFWIGNLMLLVLNIPLIGIWVRVLSIPYQLLYPAVMLFVCIGAYSLQNSVFDVVSVLFFGLVGSVLRLKGYHLAPILIGFVLGPMLEEYFRRSMIIFNGSFSGFVDRPVALFFAFGAVALIAYSVAKTMRSFLQRGKP